MKIILQTLALPLQCFLFFLALLSHTSIAQTYRNITLGSSLTASNDNASWTSPSGDFAFGFQQIGVEGFLLAVWFDKIPEKTIVWSANPSNPLQRGSTVQLTKDGQFLLNDPNGLRIWSAPFSGILSYAAMLDNGNFILASQDSVNLWETFDNPTDTILPTQTLSQGTQLVARISETNYSNGRFLLVMRKNGNLVLCTTSFPTNQENYVYWSTQTVGSGFQVVFNQSGYIFLTAKNNTILNYLSTAASPSDFYQIAVLEYDGVFRHSVYPKSSGSSTNRWSAAWSTVAPIPPNICLSIMSDTGSGACGFNSYCSLGSDQRPTCQCPPGYTIIDPNDELSGCRPTSVSQSCDEPSQDADLFDIREMPNTDWPLSDFAHYTQVTEDWCRGVCLGDCLCAVAIFRDGNCWKKKLPLSNGRVDASVGGKALIKVPKENSTLQGPNSNNIDHSTLILTGSVLLGGSVFLNIVLLLATVRAYFYFSKRRSKVLQPYTVTLGMSLQNFTYMELEHSTNGFKEELGQGAFGTVYKGELPNKKGDFVAVKKLEKLVKEGEREFETEVLAIGRTNHKNLVQLLGFCNEGQHRLLVYEFMSNRSLADFLFGNPRFNWCTRVQIAFGVSRGLCYLHEGCSTQTIHCDIKPQNILLDDSFNAKISDFGLAKLLSTNQTQTTTGIRGTKGYVAPEWFKNMPITIKVDVYSYGILLLELLFCRKNFEPMSSDENSVILADWAYDCYKNKRLSLLIENDEDALHDMKRLERFVMVALWCIQEDPSLRPTMRKVTQMLEGAVEVSAPPDPSSFISSI
ncbi:Bulb-type lectin domain [Dillenia turbinata]|uniref:Receptor-like serine/threonine-protein kinase n=1 Tax=Dillenia turbinata TaxID=194707 RepID=A0AAN8Z414_9MAGN